MRFWDSSAIVPLLVGEATTEAMQAIALEDPAMLVWWTTEVECASAVARLERQDDLSSDATLAAHVVMSWSAARRLRDTRSAADAAQGRSVNASTCRGRTRLK